MNLISRAMLKRRPTELGKIKIGMKGDERPKQGGGKYRLPTKIDHFRITTRERGKDENFVRDDVIHAELGEKPRELEGFLMFHTVGENLHTELTQYKGQTKVTECDGETLTVLASGVSQPCPRLEEGDCPRLGSNPKGCKPYARLHVVLRAAQWTGGYHVFRTTSWETANNLQSSLEEIFERFGTLYHAPVKLILYSSPSTYKDGTETKTSISWKVGIVLSIPVEEAGQLMTGAARAMVTTRAELKQLAAGVSDDLAQTDVAEDADIAAEFHPPREAATADATDATMDALKDQLGVGRESEAPILEAEIEEDGDGGTGTVPEPAPVDTAGSPSQPGLGLEDAPPEVASEGMRDNLRTLRDKAAAGDLLEFEQEEAVARAIEGGDAETVKGLIADLSMALMDAKKGSDE